MSLCVRTCTELSVVFRCHVTVSLFVGTCTELSVVFRCNVSVIVCRDLYGAVGFPLRLSRTVVTGRKVDVVSRLLNVLSYFVRCSEVHENLQGNGPFSREAHSCMSTVERLEEDHCSDSDNVPGGSVSGHPNDCDCPSQSNCDRAKCIFETTSLEGMVSGGSVANANIGDVNCDVGSSNSETKSSTVWYVDLPCEATEAETEEKAIGEERDNECRCDTVQESSGGHCDCVFHESDRPLSVRVMTSKTACESSVNVHSPVLRNTLQFSHITNVSHDELTPPSGLLCSQKRTVLHFDKTKPHECHKLTAGGHMSSDRCVTVHCGRVDDSCIENTNEDHVPQPLFLFRRFDQCQAIYASIAGKDQAVDSASDSGCTLSENSLQSQRSDIYARDSELQPSNSDDNSSWRQRSDVCARDSELQPANSDYNSSRRQRSDVCARDSELQPANSDDNSSWRQRSDVCARDSELQPANSDYNSSRRQRSDVCARDSELQPVNFDDNSSRRQRSDVCARDSELQPANSDDNSSHAAATRVQVYNAGDMQVSSTDANNTGELDNDRCQLSPSFIREETKVLRVRLVGRMAPSEISQTHTDIAPELCDIATRSCSDHNVPQDFLGGTCAAGNSLSCHHQGCVDASDKCDTKDCECLQQVSVKQMFHDSGVFDVTDASRTVQRDSGICITGFHSSNSVKTECTETMKTNSGAKDLCHTSTVPNQFTFSRSNSMFDEYFKDDVADGAVSIPTEDIVDHFCGDTFSEYLDAPMPDVSEVCKYSAARQAAALKYRYTHLSSMEESPSMFDEYFTGETNLVSSRQSKCEITQDDSVLGKTKRQGLRRQSDSTRNVAESAARNAATGHCMRRKHRSEETVVRRKHRSEETVVRRKHRSEEMVVRRKHRSEETVVRRKHRSEETVVRRKHRSEETVIRKNSSQHCCNVLLSRQISSPAPSGAPSTTRYVLNYAFLFNIKLHMYIFLIITQFRRHLHICPIWA